MNSFMQLRAEDVVDGAVAAGCDHRLGSEYQKMSVNPYPTGKDGEKSIG
jgi:hypothetical protein